MKKRENIHNFPEYSGSVCCFSRACSSVRPELIFPRCRGRRNGKLFYVIPRSHSLRYVSRLANSQPGLQKFSFYFGCLDPSERRVEVVTRVRIVLSFSPFLIFSLPRGRGGTKMPTSGMIKTRKASETNCFNLKLHTGFGTFTF